MAIFKALLFFNLPWDLIKGMGAKPVKGYSFPSIDDYNRTHELKDLIEEQEGDNEENKINGT